MKPRSATLFLFAAIAAAQPATRPAVSGELKRWGRVTLTFDGPATSEDATPNPFRDYRLSVVFTHAGGKTHTVAGFYAADGNAAATSAAAGNKWRVHFTPDEPGEWRYRASFRSGADIALSPDPQAGTPAVFDGAAGSFRVAAGAGKGTLRYVGRHHLQYAGSGEWFLKGGADSPENFLAYHEFDGTFDADKNSASYQGQGDFLHKYEPHVRDWRRGDPSWQSGKGKGIIGALNYLAGQGMNSVYFLTYNIDGGDGRDTWIWTKPDVRDRFDASKLDQWEIVFSHMDRLGIQLHVVTQETENDRALGGGPGLNDIRKLYYRELVARFAHHHAVIWNLGEENNTPDNDRKAIAAWIRSLDSYKHPITVHTHNDRALKFYDGILGDGGFEATSIQGAMRNTNAEAIALRRRSAAAGRPWAIFYDEQSSARVGVKPDADDPDHDEPRKLGLWGNLMGGGSGVEWYFGSNYAHMDINCEDWRSRDRMWAQTRHALEFFRRYLPFQDMEPDNTLVTGVTGAYALAKGEQVYAVYLPAGGEARVRLGAGSYSVDWYNPRAGGAHVRGVTVRGPGEQSIGRPPAEAEKDWAVLIRKR